MPANIRIGSSVEFLDIMGRFGTGIVRGVDRETYGEFVYVIKVRSMQGERDPVPLAYAYYDDVYLPVNPPTHIPPEVRREAYTDYIEDSAIRGEDY